MKSYKTTVTEINELIVQVDPEIWTEDRRKEFARVFWPMPDLEDVAKIVAENAVIVGLGRSMEGFGKIETFYDDGDRYYNQKDDDQYCDGIKITVVMESEYETEANEPETITP